MLLLTAAATRDERFFDRADEFVIDRPPSLAVGFGVGIHSCLGAVLLAWRAESLSRKLSDVGRASRSTSPGFSG